MVNNKRRRDIIHRWEGNPAITTDDLTFNCADVCNAGAVKINGEYLLLVTIQSLEGFYAIFPARSQDGYHFTVADHPVLTPTPAGPDAIHECQGVLDARITRLDDQYYVTYDALGKHGYRLGLAKTKDFQTFQRLDLISEPDTKSGALFPGKIKGKYVRLARPWERGSIWLTYSDDLIYWGQSEVVMTPRGGHWDCDRIGVATPPTRIPSGWLFIYYGVKRTSAGPLFRLGAALLDPDDPVKVLGRTNVPILSPRERYERIGDMPNLVYSCGAIFEPDGEVKLYYGASNSCVAIGATTVDVLERACLENPGNH